MALLPDLLGARKHPSGEPAVAGADDVNAPDTGEPGEDRAGEPGPDEPADFNSRDDILPFDDTPDDRPDPATSTGDGHTGPKPAPPTGPAAGQQTGPAPAPQTGPGSAPNRPRRPAPARRPEPAPASLEIPLAGGKLTGAERLRAFVGDRAQNLRPARRSPRSRRSGWRHGLIEGDPGSFGAHTRYVKSRSWVPYGLNGKAATLISLAGALIGYAIGDPLVAIGNSISGVGQKNGRILVALVFLLALYLAVRYGR